jgi:DNA-binding transcriptional regulator PaaX
MRKEKKRRKINKYAGEIAKLTATQVLSAFFELALPFFEASSIYRTSARQVRREIDFDKTNIREKIQYLRQRGMIESFVEDKERYFELTPKAIETIKHKEYQNISIPRPDSWDKKWRLVIFDIPEDDKVGRNIFRGKITSLGFKQIQKSVYAYPFECSKEIVKISNHLGLNKFITIIFADIIQGEEKLIEQFLDDDIISNDDLI